MSSRSLAGLLSLLLLFMGFLSCPELNARPPAKKRPAPARKPLPQKAKPVLSPASKPKPQSLGKVLPAGTPEFIWKIVSPGATVFVTGTFHVLKPDFYPLPDEIERALVASQNLVLELDLSKENKQALQALMQARGVYRGGQTLKGSLTPETYELLCSYLQSKGKSAKELDPLKPWVVYLKISVDELLQRGYNPNLGVDRHFAAIATKTGKKIIGLETEESQVGLLSGFDEPLQDKLLALSIYEMKDFEKDLDDILSAWWKGDDKLMGEVIFRDKNDHPELIPVCEKMYDQRNEAMVEKIDAMIKSGGTYFVAVGAGHLVGEKGILSLMRGKGYEVEQIKAGSAISATPPAKESAR